MKLRGLRGKDGGGAERGTWRCGSKLLRRGREQRSGDELPKHGLGEGFGGSRTYVLEDAARSDFEQLVAIATV